jgi:hypothetical protein
MSNVTAGHIKKMTDGIQADMHTPRRLDDTKFSSENDLQIADLKYKVLP